MSTDGEQSCTHEQVARTKEGWLCTRCGARFVPPSAATDGWANRARVAERDLAQAKVEEAHLVELLADQHRSSVAHQAMNGRLVSALERVRECRYLVQCEGCPLFLDALLATVKEKSSFERALSAEYELEKSQGRYVGVGPRASEVYPGEIVRVFLIGEGEVLARVILAEQSLDGRSLVCAVDEKGRTVKILGKELMLRHAR